MFSLRRVSVGACCAAIVIVASACAPPGSPPTSPPPTATASPSPTAPVITIDVPASGETVSVPFIVSGTANTFEAALTVDVQNEALDTLCVRNITATSGSGTPGTWETVLAFPPQDTVDERVTLRAYEISARDGSIVNVVEREITVSAERPPIFITTPVCGDEVEAGGTLAITGRATVFEAALTVELRDASGVAVVTRNILSEVGNEESNFSTLLDIPAGLAAGMYDLVAFSHSARDGSIIDEFPVQILVR